MTAPAWMPLYIAEYLGDTGHLSTVEHGAYMLLIMHYWQNDGLPTDDVKLARIARLSLQKWRAIRPNLIGLFRDGWEHKRIEAELAIAREMIKKRSAAGKAGASARYSNRMAIVRQERSDRMANAQQTDGIVRVRNQNQERKEAAEMEQAKSSEVLAPTSALLGSSLMQRRA